jgi:hypothetical protein
VRLVRANPPERLRRRKDQGRWGQRPSPLGGMLSSASHYFSSRSAYEQLLLLRRKRGRGQLPFQRPISLIQWQCTPALSPRSPKERVKNSPVPWQYDRVCLSCAFETKNKEAGAAAQSQNFPATRRRSPSPSPDISTEVKVGTPRCGVPAPCRRGTGPSPSDQFVALGTECSAAERGRDGAARHPYLGFVASCEMLMKYPG